jgi:hypothetical protein
MSNMSESVTINESVYGPYLIIVTGGTEIDAFGPYASAEIRDQKAKDIWNGKDNDLEMRQDYDSIFGMDLEDGKPPSVWSFGDLREEWEGPCLDCESVGARCPHDSLTCEQFREYLNGQESI